MTSYSVHIKPLKIEQASISYHWRNDPEVWRFTGKKPDKVITHKIEEEWLKKVLQESNSKRFGIWADENYVGNIQLTGIQEGQTAEYHIFIGNKDFWGKGVAKLATFQILRFAKHSLLLKEVFLKVNVSHASAIRLYQTCGFKKVSEEDGWLKMKINFSTGKIYPKLSVFMMTYNHALYLEEAINGILNQQCSFDFDIVIGDDFSSDDTRAILFKFAEEYPGKFKLLLHPQNIGAYQNQNAVFNSCEGEFVAICEGDDYWDDSNKLQKQVDFLESHPDYVISFHEVEKIDPSGQALNQSVLGKERWNDLEMEEIIAGDLIPSVSAVFRGKYLSEFLQIKTQVKNGDTFLFAILGQYGKAHFHDDIRPAKYRIHGGGVWSGSDLKSKIESQVLTFETLRNVVLPKNQVIVDRSLFERYLTQITRFNYTKKEKVFMYINLWKFCFKNRLVTKMVASHFQAIKNKIKI